MFRKIALIALLAGFSGAAWPETAYIDATQDNTLYQSPGGLYSNGMGPFIVVGQTQDLLVRRALVAFKDLDAIPSGATVVSVKLHLFLAEEPIDPTNVDLHRVTSDWGEDDSVDGPGETDGANAEPGDATWIHTFYSLQKWLKAGGDFIPQASDSQLVSRQGWYTFGSTDAMVADVQGWVDDPGSRFGWILLGNELTGGTRLESALQFFSHDFSEPEYHPMLEVQYSKTGSGWDFSGPWYDPSMDGEGYPVYQTPEGWLIYYFGYGLDGGFMWLVSELVPLEKLYFGEPFDVPMLIGKPGTFYEPGPSSDLSAYGTLSVEFDTCTSGKFVLNGNDGEKTSNVSKLIGVDNTNCLTPLQMP